MKDKDTEFSILVDRSVGGSSIFDGQLELMLHRFTPCFCILFPCSKSCHFFSFSFPPGVLIMGLI